MSFHCIQLRHVFDASRGWLVERCGADLLSVATQERGVCNSCEGGWAHHLNYPVGTAQPPAGLGGTPEVGPTDDAAVEIERAAIRVSPVLLRRLRGAEVVLHKPLHGVQVIMCGDTKVGTLRYRANVRRTALTMQGFEWWGPNRVLGFDRWNEVRGFDRMADARKLAVKALKLCGARVVLR